jgi:hypothetical protein
MPTGATMSIQNSFHPGFTYIRTAQNTTQNGSQNYNYANYTFSPNSNNASLLIPDESYSVLLYDNQPYDKLAYSSVVVQSVVVALIVP